MAAQGPGVDDGAPAPSVDLRRLRVGTATARCARGSAAWTRAVVLGEDLTRTRKPGWKSSGNGLYRTTYLWSFVLGYLRLAMKMVVSENGYI